MTAVWVREIVLSLTVAIAGVVIPKAAVSDANVALLEQLPEMLVAGVKVLFVTCEAAQAFAAAITAASAAFSRAVSDIFKNLGVAIAVRIPSKIIVIRSSISVNPFCAICSVNIVSG